MQLDAGIVLLQWATGGLLFLWVTVRHGVVGRGYGWLVRGTFGVVALGAAALGEWAGLAVAAAAAVSSAGRFPPAVDLVAPAIGCVALVLTGSVGLELVRTLVGAAFLGCVSDAMLLGHWYLVQPGLSRAPLHELNRWLAVVWPFEVGALLWPTGMFSVLSGRIDDGWNGLLGWFWVACAVTTLLLTFVTRAALKERAYSAVMAATGLLYLAILTAFGTDLVARALLAG